MWNFVWRSVYKIWRYRSWPNTILFVPPPISFRGCSNSAFFATIFSQAVVGVNFCVPSTGARPLCGNDFGPIHFYVFGKTFWNMRERCNTRSCDCAQSLFTTIFVPEYMGLVRFFAAFLTRGCCLSDPLCSDRGRRPTREAIVWQRAPREDQPWATLLCRRERDYYLCRSRRVDRGHFFMMFFTGGCRL